MHIKLQHTAGIIEKRMNRREVCKYCYYFDDRYKNIRGTVGTCLENSNRKEVGINYFCRHFLRHDICDCPLLYETCQHKCDGKKDAKRLEKEDQDKYCKEMEEYIKDCPDCSLDENTPCDGDCSSD